MTWVDVSDVLAEICLVGGALLGLVASIGMVRLPDLLSRMHAAAKPQVLGLLLVLAGLALRLRDPSVLGLLGLVALFQLLTTPVAAHMVARASFRAGHVETDRLVVDELSPVLEQTDPRGAP